MDESVFVTGFRTKLDKRIPKAQIDIICEALEKYTHGYQITPISTEIVPAMYSFPRELDLFLAVKRQDGKMSEKSREQYEMCLKDMHMFLKLPIKDITTMHLRVYLDAISRNKLTGNPIAKGTMNQRKCIIRSYFHWLYEEEFIPKDVSIRIKVEKNDAKPREAYQDTDIERIRNSCDSLRDRAIVDLFTASGIRVSELVSLNRKDIDLEKRQFTVFGKGSKWRTAFFDARVVVSIEDYLSSREDDCEALFVSERKPYRRISTSAVRQILHGLTEGCGVDDLIPHRFRHTMATEAMNAGMPIESVQAVLGHSRIETTMRYAHIANDKIKSDYKRYVR